MLRLAWLLHQGRWSWLGAKEMLRKRNEKLSAQVTRGDGDMNNCNCGKPVRLRGLKVSIDRKKGINHWIEHMDGSRFSDGCTDSVTESLEMKPYPKVPAWDRMIAAWDAKTATN
jgi:hypothetical protein